MKKFVLKNFESMVDLSFFGIIIGWVIFSVKTWGSAGLIIGVLIGLPQAVLLTGVLYTLIAIADHLYPKWK